MKKYLLIGFIFLIYIVNSYGKDLYLGYWLLPNEKVIIEIKKENLEYIGYVRWLKDRVYPEKDKMAGQEQIDRKNSNKNLRNRKIIELRVVGGLYKGSDNKLIGGWIYDSWNGKMYYGMASILDEDTLNLKGSFDKWGILGYTMKIKRCKNINEYIE